MPVGNDNNMSALAAAAGVVQAPNDAIYVLPSTVATRGSLSWFASSEYAIAQIDLGVDLGLFGYPHGVHPIVHANANLGLGTKGFFVGPEASTALAWTGAMSDLVVSGFAAYGTAFGGRAGVFAGKQEGSYVFRGSVSYDY